MREFIRGSIDQFRSLDQELSCGIKYRFSARELPDGCSPRVADLYFAKINDTYCVYIHNQEGIHTTITDSSFREFLARGEVHFYNINELMAFFHSLQPLFLSAERGTEESSAQENESARVVDIDRVCELSSSLITEPRSEKVLTDELKNYLQANVFGQDHVIEGIVDLIGMHSLRESGRPLTIAFLGPTGVGKTETAKAIAKGLSLASGVDYSLIQIPGNELIGEMAVHRFFGAPPGYIGYGGDTLLQPLRSNPNHVVIIDEIEKADLRVLDGLMEAIDAGRLCMADNSSPIDLTHSILLFTSNLPVDVSDCSNEFQRSECCRDAFAAHCGRPEISGKIGNFLVFQPLNTSATIQIIVKFIREELASYNLRLARIDERLMADFLNYQTKYGARGLRHLVSISVGRHLLKSRNAKTAANDRFVSMSGCVEQIQFVFAD